MVNLGQRCILGVRTLHSIERSVLGGNDSARQKREAQMSEMLYRWRWWIWSGFVLAWTVALLVPIPSTGSWGSLTDLEGGLKFLLAKSLRVSAYAFLSVLSAWLRAPVRYRFLLIFCLMAHAPLPEVLRFALE